MIGIILKVTESVSRVKTRVAFVVSSGASLCLLCSALGAVSSASLFVEIICPLN